MKVFQTLAVLAFCAANASAQQGGNTDDQCGHITVTHTSQGTLIPCRTVSSLQIETGVAGSLVLDGIVNIKGNLTIPENARLSELSSASLATVEGTINALGVPELGVIQLPALNDFGGLRISNAPELFGLVLGQSGGSAGTFELDNTGMETVDLILGDVESLTITNNKKLSSYNSSMKDLSGDALFQNNGNNLSIILDDLIRAVTFRTTDTRRISLPSLRIAGDLSFTDNNFQSLSLPELEVVMSDLSITGNKVLSEMDFPVLSTIGGSLAVIGNPALVELHGFPKLKEVDVEIELNGTFKSIKLPSLIAEDMFFDGFWIQSSEDITSSCADIRKVLEGEQHLSLRFSCEGEVTTSGSDSGGDNSGAGGGPGTSSGQGEDQEPGTSSQGLSGGVIAGIVVGVLAAIAIGVGVFLVIRKRRTRSTAPDVPPSTAELGSGLYPADAHVRSDKPELQGNPRAELASPVPELAGGWTPKETVYYEVDGTGLSERK